jgi:hypothetical protein
MLTLDSILFDVFPQQANCFLFVPVCPIPFSNLTRLLELQTVDFATI